jgi:hypothetical protein
MKRLALTLSWLLLMIPLLAAGCTREVPPPQVEVVNSCVSCHSDKDLLKQTATPVEAETSEVTSGEG